MMIVQKMTYTNSICKKQNFSKGGVLLSTRVFCVGIIFLLLHVFQGYAYTRQDNQRQTFDNIKDSSDTVHIALYGHDFSINFYKGLSNLESHIQTALFSGLVTLDATTLSIQNNLAASWFVNDDATEYTFHLRADAVFSDGTTITARDVKESWLTILRSHSGFSYLLEPIVGVLQYQAGELSIEDIGIDVVSDKTVRVRLERPNSEFIKIIAHSVFSITKASFSKLDNWESMISLIPYSGPYGISEMNDDYILLQKNQLYWAKEFVQSEYVVLHFYESDEEEKLAEDFLYGNIHWSTFSVDNDQIDTSWLYINPIFGTSYLFFRTAQAPWDNAEVRTAIRLLIPFDDIRDNDYSFPATTLVPYLYDYYDPPEVESKQDVEKALMMLEEAGYPEGKGLPPLVILVPTFNDEYSEIFDTIKSYIEDTSSIVVDIQKRPSDEYLSSLSSDDFVIGSYDWIGDYVSPAAFLQMWVSPNNNLGHSYNNEEYREAYKKAMSIDDDDDDKLTALQDTERILLETTVVIPLNHLYAVNMIRYDILEGWEENILDQHHFALLSQQKAIPIPFITKLLQKK